VISAARVPTSSLVRPKNPAASAKDIPRESTLVKKNWSALDQGASAGCRVALAMKSPPQSIHPLERRVCQGTRFLRSEVLYLGPDVM
jgi:hypothetical protein